MKNLLFFIFLILFSFKISVAQYIYFNKRIDVTGRLADSYSLTSNDHLLKIDTKPYPKGIYYVMLVVDGNRTKVEKLVIQ